MKARALGVVLVAALLAACGASTRNCVSPVPSYKASVEFAVDHDREAKVYCGGKYIGSGSAVMVGPGVGVTAGHVADEVHAGCRMVLINHAGEQYAATVRLRVQAQDLAVLAVPGDLFVEPVNLAADPWLGEPLVVVGHPVEISDDATHLSVTRGALVAFQVIDGLSQHSAPAYFGNSGGGVWTEDGQLLGIHTGGQLAPIEGMRPMPYEGRHYFVPASDVRLALRAAAAN